MSALSRDHSVNFRLRHSIPVVIAAAAFIAPALANPPLPLESPAATPTESVSGGLCNMDPLIALWCFIASPSA